jgi:hypothetical protein
MITPPPPVKQLYEARIASKDDSFQAFAGDRGLGKLRDPAERAKVPAAVLESCDFYHKNVLEEDFGNVQVFRVTVEGSPTFATVVTTDGGDGWLEVFDENGKVLGTARIDGGIVLWRPRDEIRRRVEEGLPLEIEFVAARERRLKG